MYKSLISLLFLFVLAFSSSAQVSDSPPPPPLDPMDENTVFSIVEQMPEYEGGQAELMNFISKNIVYPQNAIDNNIEGRVFVTFVVTSNGSLEQVKVLRGIPGGEELGKEAVRVVKLTNGKWKPGKQFGKPVSVQFNLPISFKLQ